MNKLDTRTVHAARAVIRRHSASFSLASRLFPESMRDATALLYAFLRTSDDIVDSPDASQSQFDQWCALWYKEIGGEDCGNEIVRGSVWVFRQYKIPTPLVDDFFNALQNDLTGKQYETFDDLREYLYGVGGVVGIMMAYVVGFSEDQALAHARTLGEGMQLVNIMRDIKEDYAAFGRIYLPVDDLAQHGVARSDIKASHFSENFARLMRDYDAIARSYFSSGNEGIRYLSPKGRVPVLFASKLYEAILDELAKQEYNPFVRRARTSLWRKLRSFSEAVLAA